MRFKIPSKISIAFQVCIWITFFFAVMIVFLMDFNIPPRKLVPIVLLNLLINIILVNVHLYFLIPNFFKAKKRVLYIFLLLILTAMLSLGKAAVIFPLKSPDSYEGFFTDKGLWIAVATSVMMLVLTLPLLFIDEVIEKKVQAVELKNKALETELQFLKMQVNPHFLFNVLNNVYSMIYTKNENAGPTVLKLSGLMRYMLYDTSEPLVLFQKEIEYLQEYIDLQTIKQKEQSTVQFSVGAYPKELKLQPFLLIPLLENAFKHGNWDAENGKGWMKCEILYANDTLFFDLSNSVSSPARKETTHGIGLKNVQQRLKLFYPEQHQLEIKSNKESHQVRLQIQFV
jgi:LytS/YehU family sensor histidine kinase